MRTMSRVSSASHDAVARLTPREAECLTHLSRGCRQSEIAVILGVRVPTVEMHLNNARAKLGAKTSVQAVAVAVSDGLIDPR